MLGRLATFGVKSTATKLNSLLSVLCCRVEAHVEAIEARVHAAHEAQRPPAPEPAPGHATPPARRHSTHTRPPIVGDEDLRDLFLSRCRTVVGVGRVWTCTMMVSFCDDLGVVEPSPSDRDAGALRSRVVAATGLPPASPIPVSVVETLVDACLAETSRHAGLNAGRDFRPVASSAYLAMADVMSVLGDVASLVFLECPRPGVVFRQYIAAVLQTSESAAGEVSHIQHHPQLQSPWSTATDTDASNDGASPSRSDAAGDGVAGRGDDTAWRGSCGLSLAPRVGLPVLHEVALLHVYER